MCYFVSFMLMVINLLYIGIIKYHTNILATPLLKKSVRGKYHIMYGI